MPVLSDPFGSNLDFDSLGIQLPNFNVRGLPNFPNFRLYDFPNSPCDTLGINTPVATNSPVDQAPQVSIWPNPFSDYLNIQASEALETGRLRLYDSFGRIAYEGYLSAGMQNIEVAQLPSGMYWWEVATAQKAVRTGKLVKAR